MKNGVEINYRRFLIIFVCLLIVVLCLGMIVAEEDKGASRDDFTQNVNAASFTKIANANHYCSGNEGCNLDLNGFLNTKLTPAEKQTFFQNLVTYANWADANTIIGKLSPDNLVELVKQIPNAKGTNSASWTFAWFFEGGKDKGLSDTNKISILKALNSAKKEVIDADKYLTDLWNGLVGDDKKPDKAERQKLINLLKEPKNKLIDVANRLAKNVVIDNLLKRFENDVNSKKYLSEHKNDFKFDIKEGFALGSDETGELSLKMNDKQVLNLEALPYWFRELDTSGGKLTIGSDTQSDGKISKLVFEKNVLDGLDGKGIIFQIDGKDLDKGANGFVFGQISLTLNEKPYSFNPFYGNEEERNINVNYDSQKGLIFSGSGWIRAGDVFSRLDSSKGSLAGIDLNGVFIAKGEVLIADKNYNPYNPSASKNLVGFRLTSAAAFFGNGASVPSGYSGAYISLKDSKLTIKGVNGVTILGNNYNGNVINVNIENSQNVLVARFGKDKINFGDNKNIRVIHYAEGEGYLVALDLKTLIESRNVEIMSSVRALKQQIDAEEAARQQQQASEDDEDEEESAGSAGATRGSGQSSYTGTSADFKGLPGAEKIPENGVALVDFYADWCGACRAMESAISNLRDSSGNLIPVVRVNTDQNRELAAAYGVRSLPTFVAVSSSGSSRAGGGVIVGGTSATQLTKLVETYRSSLSR